MVNDMLEFIERKGAYKCKVCHKEFTVVGNLEPRCPFHDTEAYQKYNQYINNYTHEQLGELHKLERLYIGKQVHFKDLTGYYIIVAFLNLNEVLVAGSKKGIFYILPFQDIKKKIQDEFITVYKLVEVER